MGSDMIKHKQHFYTKHQTSIGLVKV